MVTEADCKAALDQHEQALVRRKNVVGLGIVAKEDRTGKQVRGDLAVAVYVRKKRPIQELDPKDVIPPELVVRTSSGETRVATRVIEQGIMRLE